MAIASRGRKIEPGSVGADQAHQAQLRVHEYLRYSTGEDIEVVIDTPDGPNSTLVLPRPVVEMFEFMLDALSRGRGVQVLPVDAEITTQEAADALNVSRPYLIRLLEEHKIPYRLVGRHRRIRVDDLRTYMRRDEAERKRAADELTRLDEELGLL